MPPRYTVADARQRIDTFNGGFPGDRIVTTQNELQTLSEASYVAWYASQTLPGAFQDAELPILEPATRRTYHYPKHGEWVAALFIDRNIEFKYPTTIGPSFTVDHNSVQQAAREALAVAVNRLNFIANWELAIMGFHYLIVAAAVRGEAQAIRRSTACVRVAACGLSSSGSNVQVCCVQNIDMQCVGFWAYILYIDINCLYTTYPVFSTKVNIT